MTPIEQTANKLEFKSSLPPLARLLFLLFGLIPLLAPYELLIKPNWTGRISIVMLFFLVISIGATIVSLFFIAAALLGRSQHIQFDASNRVIRYRYKTALHPFREARYDFSQVEALELKTTAWDSSPDTYSIILKIRDQRDLTLGDFVSGPDAEDCLAVLEEMIL
jgi:hypothetical protein